MEDVTLSFESQITTATLELAGLTCAACVHSVESALCKLPGVSAASVTLLPNQRATVTYDTSALAVDALKETVENVGYDVTAVHAVNDEGVSTTVTRILLQASSAREGASNGLLVVQIIKNLGGIVEAEVEQMGPNPSHNVIRVRHDPSVIGVRKLLRAITAAVPEAKASLAPAVKPPKNNRDLQVLLLGFVVAIAAFVLLMLAMVILPPGNKFRKAMETPISGIQIGAIVGLVLATIAEFVVGAKFWAGAYHSLFKAKTANMDVLVVLGTGAAYFYSLASLIRDAVAYQEQVNDPHRVMEATPMSANPSFFESSIFIIFFVLLGKFLMHVASDRTSDAISKLLALQPDTAILVKGDTNQPHALTSEEEIKVDLLEIGDVLKVVSGSAIPTDGTIVHGSTYVDESMLTGESVPVAKKPGDMVFGGTINSGGVILVKVQRIGSDTAVARISSLIANAQSSRASIQSAVDRLTHVFVPVVIAIAMLTFVVWMTIPLEVSMNERVRLAFEFSMSVLVIACPCGLGLAVPTAVMVGSGVAARYGILVAGGGASLEGVHATQAFVFDKTGTLTVGKPVVVDAAFEQSDFFAKTDSDTTELWKLVGEIESASSHPLAKAVVDKARAEIGGPEMRSASDTPVINGQAVELGDLGKPPDVSSGSFLSNHYRMSNIEEVAGRGLRATLVRSNPSDGADLSSTLTCLVGNEKWMEENGCAAPSSVLAKVDAWRGDGLTTVFGGIAELYAVFAAFAITDQVRPDARMLVEKLQAAGKDVYMLTGDHSQTAIAIARKLGIASENTISGVKPEEKGDVIAGLQNGKDGRRLRVAFAGDGINDAIGLARADLSIAMGSGADIAVSSASVVLMQSQLSAIYVLLDLSTSVIRLIWRNLFWAFGYNFIAIPLAAGVFYPLGVKLEPWMAGVAMAFSSVSLVVSSLLLKLYRAPGL